MSTRGKAKVRSTTRVKKEKFYPLEPKEEKYYPLDKNFTNFNNVQYYGDSISKYDKRFTNLSDENIIVNLNQYNPSNNTDNIPMSYNETRLSALLPYRADSYALCVSNVYIPTTSIYLFEWQDNITYNTGVTRPKYKITAVVNNIDGIADGVYEQTLSFFPYVQSDTNPGAVKRVFEINQCIQSLNDAFVAMWFNMGVDSFTKYNTICYPPSFQLDIDTSLIYLVVDQRMNPPLIAKGPNIGNTNPSFTNPNAFSYPIGDNASWINIGLNYWISQWFQSSFPCTIISKNPSDDVACYLNVYNDYNPTRFTTYPYGVLNGTIPSAYNPPISDGGNQIIFYKIYQFNSTTELFSDVQKVIVTSNLQIRPTNTRVTAIGSIANIVPNSMQYINTLIDFGHTVSSFNNSESASPIDYRPPWHMWLDVLSQDQITQLSYNVFVQRNNGVLTPLELLPGEMCSVKLMFRLK